MRIFHGFIGTAMMAAAGSGWAVTAGVGNCSGTAAVPRYAAIQQAIDNVPANSTVLVCPGNYAEQLVIDENLTLKGVADSTSDSAAAVITVPGTLVATEDPIYPGFMIAPQIMVTNGANVAISNLTVDGRNNTLAGCSIDLIGIAYINAGGSVKNSSIVNQLLAPNLRGCQVGEALLIEADGNGGTRHVDLNGSRVANFNKNGVTVIGSNVTVAINANTVFGIGSTPDIAQNGIQISGGATGSVSSNVVGDMIYTGAFYGSAGVLLYDSAGVSVTGNAISSTQYAVVAVGNGAGSADGTTIADNYLQNTATFDAVDLCASSGNTVSNNRIQGSDEAAIHVEGTTFCGSPSINNVIKKNTINAACAGILVGPGAGFSTPQNSPNTFANVVTRTLQGNDTCPATPARAPARASSRGKPSPAHLRSHG